MRQLGLSNNGLNSFFQDSSLPALNAILGVRYLVSNTELESGTLYQYVTEIDGYKVYRNPYALSLGYLVSGDIKSWSVDNNNAFAVQNQFIEKATGLEGPLTELRTHNYSAQMVDIRNSGLTNEWLGGYYFDRTDDSNGIVTFDIENDQQQPVFLYIRTKNSQEVSKLTVTMPDGESREITYGENHVVALGECPAGEISVEMTLDKSDTGYFMASACTVDPAAMDAAFGQLSQGQWQIDTFTDTYVSGSINAANTGVMFLSVPYDTGWTVKVDGQKVETMPLGEGFMGIELEAGTHQVEMSYCPTGFVMGLILSFISLALLVVIELLRARRRRLPAGMGFVEHVEQFRAEETADLIDNPQRAEAVKESEEEPADDSQAKEDDQHPDSSL